MPFMSRKPGFTLIELLIVIALIAVLAGAVIIALNPARQFSLARNSERWSHVSALAGAITQKTAENRGVWACDALAVSSTVMMTSTVGAGNYDICGCLVPNSVASLPFDPSAAGAGYTSCTTYDTGYSITKNSDGRVTIAAPGAELGVTINVTQ